MTNTRHCLRVYLALAACLLLVVAPSVRSQAVVPSPTKLDLSLGTVKDKAENAAVKALVKWADRTSIDDQIGSKPGAFFAAITRKVEFDVADKGTFTGVSLRYGAKLFFLQETEVAGLKTPKSDGFSQVVPVTLGVDADRNLKNKDALLEIGYIPLYLQPGTGCFKLGSSPVVGLVGQLGRRYRAAPLATADANLRRLKLEAVVNLKLGCLARNWKGSADGQESGGLASMFFDDLGNWQVVLRSNVWRDYVLKDTFNRHELLVRIPSGKGAFIDLKRQVGDVEPTFKRGSEFGLYLTVQY